MPISNRLTTLAVLLVLIGLGTEAWTRISDERDLRQSVAGLTAGHDSAGAAAAFAGTKAEQALARANEAAVQAERAIALATAAKQAADQASLVAASAAASVAGPAAVEAPPGPSARTGVQQGHGLALLICAACHVVAPDQTLAPTLRPAAPDFHALANRPTVNEQSLRAFLLVPHGQMPDAMLADYQVNALVAYLMSLKDQR